MKFKIKELCQIICGGTPSTTNPEYWDGDIVWLTPKDLSINRNKYIVDSSNKITSKGLNNSSTKIVPKGAVLLSSRAPIGYLAISNCELCTNQGFKSLVCNKDLINNEYLYYLLQTKVEELKSISTGSTFLELSTSTLKDYEIDIHDLCEQQHIVNILGSIDEKIENNEQKIAKIKKLMLTLFKDFQNKLLHLEPVRLGEYISFIKGRKPTESRENLQPYLTIDGMTTNNYETVSSDNMILAKVDDIMMVMDGASSGTIYSGYNGIVGSTLAKLDCSQTDILPLIEQRLIQMQDKIKELNTGSAIPHANKEFIQSITILFSNDEYQHNVIKQLNILKQEILTCRKANIKLNKLKTLYLKKFFG